MPGHAHLAGNSQTKTTTTKKKQKKQKKINLIHQFFSRDVTFQRILQSNWSRTFYLITTVYFAFGNIFDC